MSQAWEEEVEEERPQKVRNHRAEAPLTASLLGSSYFIG